MEVDLIFRKVVRLNYINLLFYLLHHFFNRIFISPSGNGILMHPLDGRSRYIQTLDIYLPTGKNSRNLIQQSGYIFRMNNDSI